MGLFDFIRGQFIEVIEWMDDSDSMVHLFPAYDNAIKMGAKLIVRESQAAVFLNEGQLADVFGPGTYTLSTQNMPVLTALKSWKYGFNSPFKADVYFVSTANFANLKWGTTNPVVMRDAEFGLVRMRGFGTYSIRVQDPAVFLTALFGTKSEFSADDISGFLKSIIVTGVSDLLAESKIPIIDIASSYEELGAQAVTRLQPRFAEMGLALTALLIENISLPKEVEAMIDRRSSMNIAGNLDQYMKFQAAEAMREAASHPDAGIAGTGAGLGAGMAMAQMFGQAISRPAEPAPGGAGGTGAGGPGAGGAPVACGQCGSNLQPEQKFCPQCGTPRPQKRFCSECGAALADNAKFCSSCGTKA